MVTNLGRRLLCRQPCIGTNIPPLELGSVGEGRKRRDGRCWNRKGGEGKEGKNVEFHRLLLSDLSTGYNLAARLHVYGILRLCYVMVGRRGGRNGGGRHGDSGQRCAARRLSTELSL